MRILFLSSHADPSGAEICLLRLLTQISKLEGLKICVINAQEGPVNSEIRRLGIKVVVIKGTYLKRIYSPKEILLLFRKCFNLKKTIHEFKPDLIHAFTVSTVRRTFLMRLLNIKTPLTATIHDALLPSNFGKNQTTFIVNSLNKFHNRIIIVSEATKSIAIEQGLNKDKINVIYNGIPINPNHVRLDSNIKNFTVGCFGRITPGKGQMILIEAANILKGYIPELNVLIIGKVSSGIPGSDEYLKNLKDYIKVHHLENTIQLIDWTDNIDNYYKKLNVYTLCSIIPDSFPNVNLEAMNHKVPIIAVDIGGSREQIDNGITGYIIPPNNSSILAEKLLYLYNNPNQAVEMGEKGYERLIEKFSIQKYTDEHLKHYNQILNT